MATAIVATVIHDSSNVSTVESVIFTDVAYTGDAMVDDQTVDRELTINRLREKLANSTERIDPVASVEAPVVDISEVEQGLGVQKCLYPDDALVMVPKWPLSGVTVAVHEGARVVYTEETIVVPSTQINNASSTVLEEVVTTVQPLLQLPLFVQKQDESSCVPSEVVGVTNGGILMFNGDVNSYRKIGENSLIGYARDGFPIYGVYEGEVDRCGGYDNPSGYRYTISTERDYIVGCYVGMPASFTL